MAVVLKEFALLLVTGREEVKGLAPGRVPGKKAYNCGRHSGNSCVSQNRGVVVSRPSRRELSGPLEVEEWTRHSGP